MKEIFISKKTVHFGHKKYSQWDSKSAPKNSQSLIISIGQTICKENIIEVNLEQIIPPEKDSHRIYYRLEQDFPWIWRVLSTIFNDFNKKSIRGIRCFKNVQTPEFRPFIPLTHAKWDIPFSSIGDIPFSPDFCFIWDIPYNFIGDTSFDLSGISPMLDDSIPDNRNTVSPIGVPDKQQILFYRGHQFSVPDSKNECPR